MPTFDTVILNEIMAGFKDQATDDLAAGHPDAFIEVIGAAVTRAIQAGQGTSTTTVTIGTGTKDFVNSTPRGWLAGTPVYIMEVGHPTDNVMVGNLSTDESPTGDLEINVVSALGSGTFANWIVLALFMVVSPPASPLPLTVDNGGTGVGDKPAIRATIEVARYVLVEYAWTLPIGTPADGQVFLVLRPATGAWVGHDDAWATYNAGSWTFETPGDGDQAFSRNTGVTYSYMARFGPTGWRVIGADAVGHPILLAYDADFTLTADQLKGGVTNIVTFGSLANLTLPAVSTMTGSNNYVTISNGGSSSINVLVTGGGLVAGASSITVAAHQGVQLVPLFTDHYEWFKM